MILADKIINERKKNGWSQEELAEQLGVSRQSISKWEGAQAVPDLQKILKMAEVFGVSTDYLLKDELEPEVLNTEAYSKEPTKENTNVRTVTLEEADSFLKIESEVSHVIANGVSLCIISPALLIFLGGLSDSGILSEALAAGIGVTAIIILVAVAVFMFITSHSKTKEYEYIEKEIIETAYGVTGMAKEKQKAYNQTHTSRIAFGVMLCILSVIPLLLSSLIDVNSKILAGGVALLLIIVAIGVNLIVRTNIISGSFKKLLQESDYSIQSKKNNAMLEPISSVYWTLVLTGYLAWSFITNKWGATWIVWPVSSILYGALVSVIKLIKKD